MCTCCAEIGHLTDCVALQVLCGTLLTTFGCVCDLLFHVLSGTSELIYLGA